MARRRPIRTLYLALLALGAPALMAGPASLATSQRTAADDLSIAVNLRFSAAATVNSLNFQIGVGVESSAGVEQTVVVRTTLPQGLSWGADAPDPSEDCITANPAVCTTRMRANEVGTIGLDWFWDVVAERAGTYDIIASVEPTDTDPDLSNNTTTFRLEVVQPTTGGGGAGGGGSASISASAVKLTPAKPKAGSAVSATVRVSAGGVAVRPSRIACSGAIGAAKVKGTGKAGSGTATCLYRTPRNAKGKTLRGTVTFTARTQRFTKRFSIRLG